MRVLMRAPARQPRDSGFTLVELMIAIFVLLVGVLGSVALVDGANRTTAATKARESGTNLARDILETAHDLTIAQAVTKGEDLQADLIAVGAPGDGDTATAGWQITRRNVTYTVAITGCAVDDNTGDGYGVHDTSVNWCASSTATGTADTNPLDYAQLRVTVSYTERGAPRQVNESGVLNNLSDGPLVTGISSGAALPITSAGVSSVDFTATTDQSSAGAEWYLNGTDKGAAAKGATGRTWNFSWSVGAATGTGTGCSASGGGVVDGAYLVGAQAFDGQGLSAGRKALTVNLNRCAPLAPTRLSGGRTILWNDVELHWDTNPEGDIAGYYVYRSQGNGAFAAIASGGCSGLLRTAACTEADPGGNVNYEVFAVDRDTSGNLRMGPASATLSAPTNNSQPCQPGTTGTNNCGNSPVVSSGGSTSTLTWATPSPQDPNSGDTIAYYNVYRDGTALSNRYDSADNTGATINWTDPDTGGVQHIYYVTSVDNHGAESALTPSGGVTR
jgi:prepilin-type N-terminal cleavage/methylation domain-containing protein